MKNIVKEDHKSNHFVYFPRPELGNSSTKVDVVKTSETTPVLEHCVKVSVLYSHLITYYTYTDYISPVGGTNALLERSTAGRNMI